MAYKNWTLEEIQVLKTRIMNKVEKGERLTFGESCLWGDIKNGEPLSQRVVDEIDFWGGIDE